MITTPPVHRIEFVGIERSPLVDAGLFRPEYMDLPEPFPTALVLLAADLDTAVCDAVDCGNPVGYALDTEDVMRWRSTWLARLDDGPVARLCEDCCPDILTPNRPLIQPVTEEGTAP